MAQAFTVDQLSVSVSPTAAEAGEAAGKHIAGLLRSLTTEASDRVRVVFAAAPSQAFMLAALRQSSGIDWSMVDAFQMDEYLGLDAAAPQRFGNWLRHHLFDHVPVTFHPLDSAADYAQVLGRTPVDLVCLGIGENGHLAFNDPPLARFDDELDVRTVTLDETSRVQQVHDGLFHSLEQVPTEAVTLTIPRLMSSRAVVGVACGPQKAPAVQRTLTGEIDASCPATILRRHPDAVLYTDVAAYPL